MTFISLVARGGMAVAMCAAALVASACGEAPGGLTGPTASATGGRISAQAASASRSGDLHITKNCGENHGLAGEFCTILTSNVKAIEAGSRVIYLQADSPTATDSDVVIVTPGPGNNRAFGHCVVDFATFAGICTFNGGTGKFTHFRASAAVSYISGFDWAWDGTFSFNDND